MIAEYGLLALIMGLVSAVALTFIPLWGAWRGNIAAMHSARPLALSLFVFCAISFALLCVSFLNDDFSLSHSIAAMSTASSLIGQKRLLPVSSRK